MARVQDADVYSRITAEIVAAIEAGAGSWKMPWHHDGSAITRPTNVSGRRYRGVNVIALWAAAQAASYGTGLWGTYRQYQALGAQVRKGERAILTTVFWKQFSARNDADDADDEDRARPRLFARAFSVFNCAQVDGYAPPVTTTVATAERNAAVDAFVAALKIPITYGAFDAHYRIDLDHVFMPPFEAFEDAASFVGTEIHECAHATGAKHRLTRDFGARFANEARSIEEITAELTAGFILADLSIAHHPRADHASYIASWLTLLKDSPRAIFTAASQAQAAADWMQSSADRFCPPQGVPGRAEIVFLPTDLRRGRRSMFERRNNNSQCLQSRHRWSKTLRRECLMLRPSGNYEPARLRQGIASPGLYGCYGGLHLASSIPGSRSSIKSSTRSNGSAWRKWAATTAPAGCGRRRRQHTACRSLRGPTPILVIRSARRRAKAAIVPRQRRQRHILTRAPEHSTHELGALAILLIMAARTSSVAPTTPRHNDIGRMFAASPAKNSAVARS